ncbi:uncharacterized protein SCODWIG_01988 [Saccharomycodes ludwigii]|uniref:N-acetylglucosaminylphosphatidylinositol deacetylase n=1 Tax=Saccharomycodes ludwigii TaxID=36035 RepID=A0A376B697_9ASCO|nr:uncharacterized protein SCODWIG_01988 [Saccharomycodes ludwigii]
MLIHKYCHNIYLFSILIVAYSIFVCYYGLNRKVIVNNNSTQFNNIYSFNNNDNNTTVTSLNLIIAHPDDEVMFFNPIINALNYVYNEKTDNTNNHSDIILRVVCLSNGNADGLGDIRYHELHNSLKALWSNHDNLQVHVANFTDSMEIYWDSSAIDQYIKSNNIIPDPNPLFITFDERGISNHPNHISCYNYVKHYISTKNEKNNAHALILQSPSFAEKYSSIWKVPFILFRTSANANTITFVNSIHDWIFALGVMSQKHYSQMVWFRFLWWTFSSLVFYNTFTYI